jgi:two-component system NtrC family sensor kinase
MGLRAYQLRVDNITITNELDRELPATVADPFQLQQVILNLINNAHHAMTECGGPGRLTLRTGVGERSLGDGASGVRQVVWLSVNDTGVGIPQGEMSRIFDPFYTTKPVGQGTGLGLSICFGIIKEHGGRIWAESEIGVGTTVTIELPLLSEIPVDSGEQSGDRTTGDTGSPARGRVLVVDDEEPVSNLLARLLRDLGHEPTVVHNGDDAIEALAQQTFDLVLTDVKMPGMSGFELHQKIGATNPALARRVVFITGDTMSAATQARLAQSGNPFIAKPFVIDKLEALIRSLLARPAIVHPE